MNDDALSAEIERTMAEYSFTWEGYEEEVTPLGQGVARRNGAEGFAMPRFVGPDIDAQLGAAIDSIEGTRRYIWVMGPSSEPADLADRLMARGFQPALHWDGLVLEDLSIPIGVNPAVTVEEANEEAAEEVGELWERETNGEIGKELVAASIRTYARAEPKQALILLGRLDGRVVSYTATRFEANGTAYLRQGLTHPDFQRRGLYLTLLKHRLDAARAAGCTRAVVQAISTTSSPILQKRGFRRVCGLVGYVRPPAVGKTTSIDV